MTFCVGYTIQGGRNGTKKAFRLQISRQSYVYAYTCKIAIIFWSWEWQ